MKSYSEALENSLEGTSEITNIDELSEKITNSILTASESTIPKKKKEKDNKPWVDDEFLELVQRRNLCKDKCQRLELNKQLKNRGIN